MQHSKKYLIVLAGPTAVGKTSFAIKLAKKLNTVIVSADSRQIYKELAIGTARPSPEQLAEVVHYMVANHSIENLYGAGHFAEEAGLLIENLFKIHDLVILTGGSGLYIDALLNGVDAFETVPMEMRSALNAEFEEKGLDWLRQEVLEKDPEFAAKADLSNPQRMIRALEIFRHTGRKFSSFKTGQQKKTTYEPIKILLSRERADLYQQINQRVDEMMAAGLEEEVKKFETQQHLNALKTVGYRELFSYFNAEISRDRAIELIKQNTRRYAKRQLTWFRNRDTFKEFDIRQEDEVLAYVLSQVQT